jgi:hypothetical protein
MGCEVYANGNEIACKAGDGKVIAAFPDVCLSPPSPPAGPIPIPYPNTSFSKDMQNGSKTVMIKGKEVMLKDQSFYKTSPLGDEAATKGLGAGLLTHVITGKTYFVAWSMDVKFEGENVDRHVDPTTSNHASLIGNVMAPMANLAVMALAWFRRVRGKCECCGKDPHSPGGTQVSMDDWYTQDNKGNPSPQLKNGYAEKSGKLVRGYDQVIADARNRKNLKPPCTCNGKLLPEPPCNKFYQKTSQKERNDIKDAWNKASRKGDGPFTIRRRIGAKAGDEVMHLTPKAAGGCATGKGNLQVKKAPALCSVCQGLDGEFGKLQGSKHRNLHLP